MTLNDYAGECFQNNRLWWVDVSKTCPICGGSFTVAKMTVVNGILVPDCTACLGTGHPCLASRNIGELLMLIVSEVAEAMEGHRKNLMDDKLPHRSMFEVELADALIRIFDLAGAKGLDLEGAYQEKTAYNKQRADHKAEARLAPGGKAY